MVKPINERRFEGVWIPRHIWLSKDLTVMEKLMLVEVRSLDSEDKGCYASNAYLAEFFGLSTSRVSEIINSLAAKGQISITYDRDGKAITGRSIRVLEVFDKPNTYSENTDRGIRETEGGYSENTKVSSTYMNNTKTEEHIPPISPKVGKVETITADDLVCMNVSKDVADEYLALRKRKRAPLTELVMKGLLREVSASGWSLNDALRECVERGWQGFKAEWVSKMPNPSKNAPAGSWWNLAGFDNQFSAENAGCTEKNFKLWKNGSRVRAS